MNPHWIRPLNSMEQAFTISNARFPLCVVCVLHLSDVREDLNWPAVLRQLQQRHRLLQCGIEKWKGKLWFRQCDPVPAIPFVQIVSEQEGDWQTVTETALNTIFETDGPLMKCWYVSEATTDGGRLIVCFHHAIIDGSAARLILHEILAIAGDLELSDPPGVLTTAVLPAPFRGAGLIRQMGNFAFRQMQREWTYSRKGLKNPIPSHSKNAIASLCLSQELSRRLAVKAGRAGLGLNSVLLAAILAATLHHRHEYDESQLGRVLSFVDLRASLDPVVAREELGCFISMLRMEINMEQQPDVWELARRINRALFRAGRKGEVLAMFKMSKQLVRMALQLKALRLGISAISFIGKLDLNARYGAIALNDVQAYITNNQYGPELSAFGKILFGRIGLDFTYLTAETSIEQAEDMIREIRHTLEKMAE